MCGICGFFNISEAYDKQATIKVMIEALRHRGPDGIGEWLSSTGIAGLGHTRLSIIDLLGGSQPMSSENGRYVIVFNGEIYNFRSLRKELKDFGHYFRTNSDTEILLAAFAQWGKDSLSRLRGMFAFAIFDLLTSKLFLGRDPTGIKPLYYYKGREGFFYGSEPKAMLALHGIPRQLNYRALSDFMILGYPLIPATFFENIYELEPGTWMEVSSTGVTKGRYWKWVRQETDWSFQDTLSDTERILTESLDEHLVSDVPLGAFLSGGIDSSLLVALLTKTLGTKVDTFNVKFGESMYDESPYAREVADFLGTTHHEIKINQVEGRLDLIGDVLDQFDQPFGDSSAIPTFLISREICKHVKVVIGGDGGDEMFGGYRRFYYAEVAQKLGRVPQSLLNGLFWLLSREDLPAPEWRRRSKRLLRAAKNQEVPRLIGLSCYNYPDQFPTIFPSEVLRRMDGYQPSLAPSGLSHSPGGRELIDATVKFALPGDYLRKVDFMSSAHGLEVRVPFLGAQVLQFGAKIPHNFRYSRTTNKILLRSLAQKYLPPVVVNKPKWGFAIPLDTWLNPQERQELQSLLCSPRAKISELICPKWIEQVLKSFVSYEDKNKSRWSRYIVYQNVYMLWGLERWLNRWNPAR